jgi:aspartate/tyrosine/aromatic aminotransferase
MVFEHVLEGPPDAIFGLTGAFQADARSNKVNLLVGIYKDEHLRAELLPSVKQAKEEIYPEDLKADYLPIDGYGPLIDLLGPVIFGEEIWGKMPIYGAHTTGGTGALRIGAELLAQEVTRTVYIPDPTWPNHRSVLEKAGCKVENYTYYNRQIKNFDFHAVCKSLEAMPEKAAVVLHACCHNPTGCDPTENEWKAISQLMLRKKLVPFFDFAYQGLGDGLDKDAEAVRIFARDGHEMLVAYSCSKNFSLYCQRVGALYIVNRNEATKGRVASQVKRIIRALYSNPPAHGALIAAHVLKKEGLRRQWVQDLGAIRHRLNTIREKFVHLLITQAKNTEFQYLKEHKGMFSFVDLSKAQVQKMIQKYGIYLLDNGRISIAGLTAENVGYVVSSILSVSER